MRNTSIARKALCWLVAAMTCIALGACVEIEYAPSDGGGTGGGTSSSGGSLSDMVSSGLTIQAERGKEELEINRVEPSGKRPANLQDDTWTVFVYICGSNLESQNAAATKDLNEMLSSAGSNKVRFVVETGGARTWRNNTMSARQLGRYVIQAGKMMDAGAVSAASMGKTETLADFLQWGIKNYPADHMGLILWDHGGGSIAGVCFDERNSNDSLTLRELDAALASALPSMWEKFDFIGFDACLMSTLETANILASYADYMYASQESEPGNGWEYKSISDYLAKNPNTDSVSLGRTVCDSYLASVDRSNKGFITLSVVDLSKIDQLIQDFYRFSQEMYASGTDQQTFAAMSRGIQKADSYGCNNRREGYTNMVDLGGLVDACASVTPSASDVKTALHNAVPYQVRGTYHAAATGLSTYYPLRVNGSKELATFQSVAVNPSYLQYVDRLVNGATYSSTSSQYENYSNDTFFSGDLWNWLLGYTTDTQQQQEVEDHWDYVEEHTSTSTAGITFAAEPQVDDNGTFWFQLDQNGIDNAAVVSALVYERSEDGADNIAPGETYDVYGDWSTGEFYDGFEGEWLSLPDGQNLNLSVVSATEDYIIYASPIELNGTECYLRMRFDMATEAVEVEGVWNGVTEGGAVDRGVTPLKKGDVIVPLYNAFSNDETVTASTYVGNPYTLTSKTLTVDYGYLPDGKYLYCFCIKDAFGDYYFTGNVEFQIDEDGNLYF